MPVLMVREPVGLTTTTLSLSQLLSVIWILPSPVRVSSTSLGVRRTTSVTTAPPMATTAPTGARTAPRPVARGTPTRERYPRARRSSAP